MFECKVCNEKDKRILDLLSQVETLTRLVFPMPVKSDSLPFIDLDALESGDAKSPDSYTELTQNEIEAEADRLLTGNY